MTTDGPGAGYSPAARAAWQACRATLAAYRAWGESAAPNLCDYWPDLPAYDRAIAAWDAEGDQLLAAARAARAEWDRLRQ